MRLEIILSIVAVLVALEGWLIADKLYRRKPARPAQYAAALPTGYKLLANKYYVDELYGAVVVKPLLGFSKFVLEWSSILSFWRRGLVARRYCHFYRSDSATLAIGQSALLCGVAGRGAAAVLLFLLVPWATVLASLSAIHLAWRGMRE